MLVALKHYIHKLTAPSESKDSRSTGTELVLFTGGREERTQSKAFASESRHHQTVRRRQRLSERVIFPTLPEDNAYYRSILSAMVEDVTDWLDVKAKIDVCPFATARDKLNLCFTPETKRVLEFLQEFHCKSFDLMDPSLRNKIPEMYSFIFTEGMTPNPLEGLVVRPHQRR